MKDKPSIIPNLPLGYDLETKAVLRQVNLANKKLAEFKGGGQTIPNESILLSTLTLQEAKESSSVENIVTTQDDLFKEDLHIQNVLSDAAAKEVLNFSEEKVVFMWVVTVLAKDEA